MTRVLVVDDDMGIREAVHLMLEDIGGYDVDEATTAQEAVAKLQAHPEPQVVLFDFFMPGVAAVQVGLLVERVRLEQVQPFLDRHALICMTASPDHLPDPFRKWLGLRGVPLVAKPFDIDGLQDTVAQAAAQLPRNA